MPDPNPEAAETTTPGATDEAQPIETFTRDYVEKLRAENARYRTRAKQAEEEKTAAEAAAKRAKMDELEAAKAELAEKQTLLDGLQTRLQLETWRADLAPLTVDPDAAVKLVTDDFVTDTGKINTDAFLDRYPYLKRDTTPKPRSSGGVNSPNNKDAGSGDLDPGWFVGKDPETVAANIHRLRRQGKERKIKFT